MATKWGYLNGAQEARVIHSDAATYDSEEVSEVSEVSAASEAPGEGEAHDSQLPHEYSTHHESLQNQGNLHHRSQTLTS